MSRINKITSGVRSIAKTATLRQTAVTFSATFVNGILGMLFYIFSARFLGPAQFGILSLSITVITLISDVGDLGTDTGLVNFISKHVSSQKAKAYKFMKLGLKVKVYVGTAMVLVGLLFSRIIALGIFNKPEFVAPLRIALFGVLFALVFSFVTHVLQAYQRFKAWGFMLILTNGIRLLLILVLYYLYTSSTTSFLTIYILMPLLGFLIAMSFIIPRDFLKIENENDVAGEFFHYNKWVAAFTMLAAVGARLDTFLTARLLTAAQLGIYSAANQLVQVVPQFVSALGTVVAPKMGQRKNIDSLVNYYKKTQALVLGIAFLGVVLLPLGIYLIPILLGAEYAASVGVFVILFFAMLFFLISVPIHNAIIYYFSYPKLFFWQSLVYLLIVAIGGWHLIGNYGVIGAAYVVLIGQMFNFVYPGVWLWLRVSNEQKAKRNER